MTGIPLRAKLRDLDSVGGSVVVVLTTVVVDCGLSSSSKSQNYMPWQQQKVGIFAQDQKWKREPKSK